MSIDDPFEEREMRAAQRRLPSLRAAGMRRRLRRRAWIGAGVAAGGIIAAVVAPLVVGAPAHDDKVQTLGSVPPKSTRTTRAGVSHGIHAVRAHVSAPIPAARLRQPAAPARAVIGGLEDFPSLYLASGGMYVGDQTTASGRAPAKGELLRIDPDSGNVLATLDLPGVYSDARLVGGTLWVLAVLSPQKGAATSTLLAVDQADLAVRRRLTVPPSGTYDSGALTAAGGWLWVAGGDSLFRVSLTSATVTAVVAVDGAGHTTVGSNSAGTVLVDGESTPGGIWRVQSRDPRTGGLRAQTATTIGVTSPSIGGVTTGGVWISYSGGMSGGVERLDLPALTFQPSSGVRGSNGVQGTVVGSTLWVTQPAGGTVRNYCADPTSGTVVHRLTEANGSDDVILGFGLGSVFYLDETHPGTIYRAPSPSGCSTEQ